MTGHRDLAIGTLLVTAFTVFTEAWIAKRRDDLFGKIAAKPKPDPVVLREITIREAIRTRQLSSEDAARLLGDQPGGGG